MRVLLITGGRHKFYETTPIIARLLRSAGHVARVTRAARELSRPSLRDYDAIILNTVRGTKEKGPYKIPNSELDNDFDAIQKNAFREFVSTGGGLLSLHVSPTSCPGWAEMLQITGGGWVWGRSWHPPYCRFPVVVTDLAHPVAAGVRDFEIDDEPYCDLDIAADAHCFLSTWHDGLERPMGWSHRYGDGRVVNLCFGHDRASVSNANFRQLALNALAWIARSEEALSPSQQPRRLRSRPRAGRPHSRD